MVILVCIDRSLDAKASHVSVFLFYVKHLKWKTHKKIWRTGHGITSINRCSCNLDAYNSSWPSVKGDGGCLCELRGWGELVLFVWISIVLRLHQKFAADRAMKTTTIFVHKWNPSVAYWSCFVTRRVGYWCAIFSDPIWIHARRSRHLLFAKIWGGCIPVTPGRVCDKFFLQAKRKLKRAIAQSWYADVWVGGRWQGDICLIEARIPPPSLTISWICRTCLAIIFTSPILNFLPLSPILTSTSPSPKVRSSFCHMSLSSKWAQRWWSKITLICSVSNCLPSRSRSASLAGALSSVP